MNKNKIIKAYREFLNEDIVLDKDVKKLENFLDLTIEEKEVINNINTILTNLKSITINEESIEINQFSKTALKIVYIIQLKGRLFNVVTEFEEYFQSIKNKIDKDLFDILCDKYYVKNIGDGEDHYLFHFIQRGWGGDIRIELERKNFNRFHIPSGFPNYLKDFRLGMLIYSSICNKCNYISTDHHTGTSDSKRIWDSLRKNHDFYTIMSSNQILLFNVDYNINKIAKILKKWFKLEIKLYKLGKNPDRKYIIDHDLQPKLKELDNDIINHLMKKSI